MNFTNIHRIYFLGIGGIGMSALARYFLSEGKKVYGYDKTPSTLTSTLQKEGAKISFTSSTENIPRNIDLVVYTPAIPKTNTLFQYFIKSEIPIEKRAKTLGNISKKFRTIAVAGTHGKTTTSAIISHILHQSNIGCNALIGGIMTQYKTNVILNKKSNILVVEADEYDRSFLHLSPEISIINSIDEDHLDVYHSEELFIQGFKDFASLTKKQLICPLELSGVFSNTTQTFDIENSKANVFTKNIVAQKGIFKADIISENTSNTISTMLAGNHNLKNILASYLVCKNIGLSEQEIIKGICSFQGIKRRFEWINTDSSLPIIDDYAHHPTEINAAILTFKTLYPSLKITVVFQPHLFSRTRDFMKQFAVSLSSCDRLFLLDIYPARETQIEGITSKKLGSFIQNTEIHYVTLNNIIKEIKKQNHQAILILGAGDISTKVQEIKEAVLQAI